MALRKITFINRTGDPLLYHDKEYDTSSIRSHAMTEVRRRKDLVSGKSVQSKSKVHTSTTAGDNVHSRFHAQATPSWSNIHDRSLSSPFSGTAVKSHDLSPDVSQRLQYFAHGFTHLTFPTKYVHYQCQILAIAVNGGDSGLLHALCAVGVIHRALIQPSGTLNGRSLIFKDGGLISRAFLYHKQRAIRSLQTNLSKSVELHDWSPLAIIAMLLMIESLLGDNATANAHRSGLLELIRCYGRIQSPSSPLLTDALMPDLKAATSSLSQPLMKPRDEWIQGFGKLCQQAFVPCRTDLVLLGSGFATRNMRQYLGPDLVTLMCAMQKLINAVEQNFDMGIDVSGTTGTHFLVMEHQLLSLRTDTRVDTTLNSSLNEGCRIAALLYCNLCLWNWPKKSTLITNLLAHLRMAVSQWNPEPCAAEQVSIWSWFCFVGSFATSSTEEYQWYTERIGKTSRWLHLRDEEGLRTVLARFFYVDRLMGQHLKNCYSDISLDVSTN